MPIDSSQIAARLHEQIASLYRERDAFLAAAAEIDAKITKALQVLGLDPAKVEGRDKPSMTRLPLAARVASYPLDPNTMGAVMIDILLSADHGYSRVEIRRILEKDPRFATQLRGNMNAYYNTVNRYLKKGRIVDVNGLLYHPDRAPLPEGADDPSGQHLPSNVSTLFPDRKAGGDD